MCTSCGYGPLSQSHCADMAAHADDSLQSIRSRHGATKLDVVPRCIECGADSKRNGRILRWVKKSSQIIPGSRWPQWWKDFPTWNGESWKRALQQAWRDRLSRSEAKKRLHFVMFLAGDKNYIPWPEYNPPTMTSITSSTDSGKKRAVMDQRIGMTPSGGGPRSYTAQQIAKMNDNERMALVMGRSMASLQEDQHLKTVMHSSKSGMGGSTAVAMGDTDETYARQLQAKFQRESGDRAYAQSLASGRTGGFGEMSMFRPRSPAYSSSDYSSDGDEDRCQGENNRGEQCGATGNAVQYNNYCDNHQDQLQCRGTNRKNNQCQRRGYEVGPSGYCEQHQDQGGAGDYGGGYKKKYTKKRKIRKKNKKTRIKKKKKIRRKRNKKTRKKK